MTEPPSDQDSWGRSEFEAHGMLSAYWARRHPDRAAIVAREKVLTYRELDARANRLVRALRSRGLKVGDAVALICGNVPEFAEVVLACQRGGYRLTPINWHLTARECAYILADCDARAVVAGGGAGEMAAAALEGASEPAVRLAVKEPLAGFENYEDALSPVDARAIEDPAVGSTMLYTSGTTGAPKGVYRPPPGPGGGSSAATINIYGYGDDGGDVHLCTGPLYHAAPLAFSLISPLAFGATVVVMDKWSAEETLALIERYGVTHTHMVPTMFHRLLAVPEEVRRASDTGSLRYVLHGAAPCPVSVKRRLIEWLGPIVWEYYAATEGTGSFVDSATWLSRPGTVGRPLVDGLLKIGDEDGVEVAAGTVGLVYLRPSVVGPFEYYKDPDRTSSAYKGDYFTLGDVGYLDDDGYLFLTDRSSNLIISGGVNIYPAEVDAVLLDHPAVGDAATIGVPNHEWGEEVLAVIEVRAGVAESPELATELVEHCRANLARFKCPRRVEFVAELPRQDNGKIYKRLLRDQFRGLPESSLP